MCQENTVQKWMNKDLGMTNVPILDDIMTCTDVNNENLVGIRKHSDQGGSLNT